MTDAPPPTLDAFIGVSVCLTGVPNLDVDLAAEYRDRFLAHPRLGPGLGALVARYAGLVDSLRRRAGGEESGSSASAEEIDEAAGAQLMADPALAEPASQLIYLWYAGAFFESDPAMPGRSAWDYGANPEHYGRGLMWSVIRAHAPMTPWPEPPGTPTDASEDSEASDADQPEQYWTRAPDRSAPVTAPPRWISLEQSAPTSRPSNGETP